MPMEKELFRDNLIRLDAAFPNQEMLRKKDVIKYTGVSYKVVTRQFPFKDNFISKTVLASKLS